MPNSQPDETSAPDANADASGPRSRLRQARVEMYRQLVLDTGEEVFAETGYEATRVQDVAAAAGISLRTLYGVFPGKWELYCAIHERHTRRLMARVAAGFDRGLSPLDQILKAMDVYTRYHVEHPTWLRMHLREGNAWAMGATLRSPPQADAWQRGFQIACTTYDQAIDVGQLIDEDPPELMVRTAIATQQMRLAHWVEGGMKADPEVMIRRMQRQFIRLFCPPDVAAERLEALT